MCVCACGNVSICNEKLQPAREVVDNLLRTKCQNQQRENKTDNLQD